MQGVVGRLEVVEAFIQRQEAAAAAQASVDPAQIVRTAVEELEERLDKQFASHRKEIFARMDGMDNRISTMESVVTRLDQVLTRLAERSDATDSRINALADSIRDISGEVRNLSLS